MVCSLLGGQGCGLSSRMLVIFLVLLVFTLLTIVTQYTITWNVLSWPSLRQHTAGSKVSQACSQATEKENINWDYLYYYQDPSKKKSLIWCKVLKAGSTTLVRMFLRAAGVREIGNDWEMHGMLRKFYPKLSPEVMAGKLNTTFKFLVVRHPFERILSAYRDKLESYSRRDPYFRSYGKLMGKGPGDNETAVEPTFPEFVTYLLETSPERYNEHWMLISQLCTPCSIHYDAIVKMENFDTEIKVPLAQAGIHEDIGWARKAGTNQGTIERYFQQLSVSQIQKLYEIYRKDFLLFGYTPSMYFSIAGRGPAQENATQAPALWKLGA